MKPPSDPYILFTQFVESKALSASTKREYLRQVRHLARFYPNQPLHLITETQVLDYLIHRRDELAVRLEVTRWRAACVSGERETGAL